MLLGEGLRAPTRRAILHKQEAVSHPEANCAQSENQDRPDNEHLVENANAWSVTQPAQ